MDLVTLWSDIQETIYIVYGPILITSLIVITAGTVLAFIGSLFMALVSKIS